MTATIQQVGGVQNRESATGVNEPGAFTAFDDGTAAFCGDGNVTCTQATAHYIEWMATHLNPELQPFVGNPAAATFGGQIALQQNPQLALATPDSAVPTGELLNLNGMSLKQLLSGFVNRLDDLTALVEQSSGAIQGNTAMARATGQVNSVGLPLPVA